MNARLYFDAMGRRDQSLGLARNLAPIKECPDWCKEAYLLGYRAQAPWRNHPLNTQGK